MAVQEEDGTLHIGRQALRDALYATTGYQGLTGSLTCDEYGDCGVARFEVRTPGRSGRWTGGIGSQRGVHLPAGPIGSAVIVQGGRGCSTHNPWSCSCLLLLLLAGCGPATRPLNVPTPSAVWRSHRTQPIKIGVLQNLSGDMGPPGASLLRCVELAVDDRGGELLGHPIELQIADSLCSGEGGTTAALKIAADPQIVGIVGPTCSGAAATAMKVVSESGPGHDLGFEQRAFPDLSGRTARPDWQPGFFRTAQNDALAGRAAATFAFEELGMRKAATINDW